MTALVFIVILSVWYQCSKAVYDTEFRFGLTTSLSLNCGSLSNITMTLYWIDRLFQCDIHATEYNKTYICNTLIGDFECDATKSNINKQYALQIDNNYYCIQQIFFQQFNITTSNITNQMVWNITNKTIATNEYFLITFNISSINNTNTSNFEELSDNNLTICYPFVSIEVTACDEWTYGSISNSLQMQLKGSRGASEFFYVNKVSQLPVNGKSMSFYIDDIDNIEDIGELYYVVMAADDEWGYCIKNITVTISTDIYQFSSDSYFGSGIILSTKCPYSYQYISSNYPLISCIDDFLELDTYSLRGIYTLDIHTCITDESGMSITNMKDKVYAVLMGKQYGEYSYTTSSITYLDHFQPETVDMQQLGHLIAGNVIIEDSTINKVYSFMDGLLIGIKIESVDYIENKFKDTGKINISVNGSNPETFIEDIFENGRYLIIFFSTNSRINIAAQITEISLSSSKSNVIGSNVNVYLIFDGYSDFYQLPFKVYDNIDTISWAAANKKCNALNGTSLISIHSKAEQFLITGYLGGGSSLEGGSAWIGMFDLTVEKQNNWKWTDGSIMDYTNWAPGEPNNKNGEDCSVTAWNDVGEWNDLSCFDPSPPQTKYICSSPQWNTNTDRIFEINVAEYLDDITLVSLGNNNIMDNICVDFVSINDESAIYISNNWFGGTSDIIQSMALFKYPVCETQIVGLRVDYDTSSSNYLMGDSSVAGLECINNGRQTQSTCTILQSYALTKTTSYSISNSDSSTNQYSWGTSSAVSLGETISDSSTSGTSETNSESNTNSESKTNSESSTNSQSTTTTNGFSWGLDESVATKVGASASFFGLFSASADVTTTVGSNQEWSESTANTYGSSQTYGSSDSYGESATSTKSKTASQSNTESKSKSKSTTASTNKENTKSTTNTNGYESSYSTSETSTIQCSASIDVPSSHKIEYSLNFNAINTTINTFTDLKLTLCSAFLNPDTIHDESNYIYINNIPGIIEKKEITACTVQFEPAQYVRNIMQCKEEQQLAISSTSSYLPRCQSSNSSLYDGCQCDLGSTGSIGVCWCVDKEGNKINNKAEQLLDSMTYQEVCVNILKCDNTAIGYSEGDIFESFQYDTAVQTKSTISFVVLFSIFTCIFLIIYGYSVYKKTTKSAAIEKQYDVHPNYTQLEME